MCALRKLIFATGYKHYHARWLSNNTAEELQFIRNTSRKFAEQVLKPNAATVDSQNTFPQEQIDKLGKLGLLSICVPKKWNGSQMDTLALSVAVEELSRGCAATGAIVSIYNCLYANLLSHFASEEQKNKFLKPYVEQVGGCFALSEPEAGSDVASLQTTAVKSGNNYVINGTKSWVTSGPIAKVAVIFATIDKNLKYKGITAFLVPLSSKGVTLGPKEDKLGIRGAECCTLHLQEVEVPEENVLGAPGEGFKIAMQQLEQGRIGIASQALGIAQSALDATVDYADTRKAFGQSLSEFQLVKSRLAEMALSVEAARLLVHKAAVTYDKEGKAQKESSMAKLAASRSANLVTFNAIQVFGGMGFVKNSTVERNFRDARVTEIYGGVSDIQKLLIADAIIAERKKICDYALRKMDNPCVIPRAAEDVVGDKRWESMHKRYVHEAKTRECEVVFIGDSIIQQLQFSSLWNEKINSLHCLNFGIGGDRVEYVLWRILNGEFDFTVAVKAVVLFVGTNNTDCTPHEVFEGILKIIETIKLKLGKDVLIVLPTLLPRGQNPNPYRERNDHVNTFIVEKFENPDNADELTKNVHVVKIHENIIQSDQSISHHLMHDYLHLTDLGYTKIFSPVYSKLVELLQ